MIKQYALSLFIFRRDLRLTDNTAFLAACTASHTILPVFIFDPRQVKNNPYRSERGIQFMKESLQDLHRELIKQKGRLYFFYGHHENVFQRLIAALPIQALYFNKDYTPFSIMRDTALTQIAKQKHVAVHAYDDTLLFPPHAFATTTHKPYTVFTPFYRKALCESVPRPVRHMPMAIFYKGSLAHEYRGDLIKSTPSLYRTNAVHGGRAQALLLMRHIPYTVYEHPETPLCDAQPSYLAAHLKFGTCSIREVFHYAREKQGVRHPFIRCLIWRDFFTMIAAHYPHVFGHSFRPVYAHIRWEANARFFKRWCSGETGFPLIDAGMRQLATTGFMHNRVRMIVASFLTKDMHIDWRKGEQWFAQNLIDYDPSVNNGNWQWAASTGCDAQPYFRIFNPWIQQKKFDPDCTYIKQWIPELRKVKNSDIHHHGEKPLPHYQKPCLSHDKEKRITLSLFTSYRKK